MKPNESTDSVNLPDEHVWSAQETIYGRWQYETLELGNRIEKALQRYPDKTDRELAEIALLDWLCVESFDALVEAARRGPDDRYISYPEATDGR